MFVKTEKQCKTQKLGSWFAVAPTSNRCQHLIECQAVCHVVRAFEDQNVVHVDGVMNPVNDIDAIHLELMFADMAHVEILWNRDLSWSEFTKDWRKESQREP